VFLLVLAHPGSPGQSAVKWLSLLIQNRSLRRCSSQTISWLVLRNHNHFKALCWDHLGKPVPEENFWALWCKGRLTEADTETIRLGATPSRLTSAHLHHPIFLQARCPSCRPTNSIKALKAIVLVLRKKNKKLEGTRQ